VSEYAARLIDSIDRLVEIVGLHDDVASPMDHKQFQEVIDLDGRVEALRMRLGIEAIPIADERDAFSKAFMINGVAQTIGFSKMGIVRFTRDPELIARLDSADWHSFMSLRHAPDEQCGFISAVGESWRRRMASLKAIAKELAVAPDLDPEEEEIVALLMRQGKRLTTSQILSEFSRLGKPKGESTIRGKLAQLTRRKVLVNRTDTRPQGYGMPEWD
jgi:hypothetical protein